MTILINVMYNLILCIALLGLKANIEDGYADLLSYRILHVDFLHVLSVLVGRPEIESFLLLEQVELLWVGLRVGKLEIVLRMARVGVL